MTRDLILGTAGHIDHGKTSLVEALTGINCDRLPEEKARGITIDIGFAHIDLPGYHLGIVDVPGHERFIKNMLAGATGIDIALLVVAADDSIMPQTREHLEILRLLGLRHGLIALTKADLVDETTREVVSLEIREMVQGTFLAEAPLIATSAHTKLGLDDLRAAIVSVCAKVEERRAAEWFRLGIDRSFVVQGHGTVVTGSVHSGSLKVGDEIEWLPRREKVRVRSLQSHDKPVEEVHRGQRAAINLAGVDHADVRRGQEVATSGYLEPSRVLTIRVTTLAGTRPLKHRQPIRFHVGTQAVMGTLALLDRDTIDPGTWGLAQLFLEEEATTTWGQPFVLRDVSDQITLGGGQILQPVARKIRRRHLELLERVEQLWSSDLRTRAVTVAWFGGFEGFTLADFVRGAALAPDEAKTLIETLTGEKQLVEIALSGTRKRLLHRDMVAELEERLLTHLNHLHEQFPLMSTHDRQKVQAQLAYVGDDALVQAVVEGLIRRKVLIGDLRRIGRADFKPKLSANLRKLKDKVIAAFAESGFQPPEVASFAGAAGGNASNLRDLFDVCCAEGDLVHVGGDLYLHATVDADMKARVIERLRQQGSGLTVAEIRDLLGTTRKYAVPLCEYLDRVGITRRDGDLRFLAASVVT
jgi:selenocysteine-specific elongation factor